jgi:hypothetical protein
MSSGSRVDVVRVVDDGDRLRLELPSGGSILVPKASVKRVSGDPKDAALRGVFAVVSGASNGPGGAQVDSAAPDVDLSEALRDSDPPRQVKVAGGGVLGEPRHPTAVAAMTGKQVMPSSAPKPPSATDQEARSLALRERELMPRPGQMGRLLSRRTPGPSRMSPAGADPPRVAPR